MTMIEILAKLNTSFITATHLHEISKMNRLKKLDNVKCFHLHVELDEINNKLIYDRKLQDGTGSEFYGLTISKYIIQDLNYINIATEIHNELNNVLLVGDKQSNYNKNIFITKCAICNCSPNINEIPLETHHIIEQKNSNKNGFLLETNKQHIHKNNKSNLVILCTLCHDKIHNNEIIIDGYLTTNTNELELQYHYIEKKIKKIKKTIL